jgi:hypothetical protein
MSTYLVFPYRREKVDGRLALDQPTKDACNQLIDHLLTHHSEQSHRIIAVAGYESASDEKPLAQLIADCLQAGFKGRHRVEVPELTWSTVSELRVGFKEADDELILVSRRSHMKQMKWLAHYLQWKHFPEVSFQMATFITADDQRSVSRVCLDTLKSITQLFLEEIGIGPHLFSLCKKFHREPGKSRPA